ncbi:hypothetical protein VP01_781g3 [Puccinia sorghi]|uniref:Uncharacterized protein n=1 Tax=Puccinia sorghi TaxID=27349 RepID=A0A0L6UD77_9BASI|nr:hypothetical protein VP01_781g3 [Puccinia sorghi]
MCFYLISSGWKNKLEFLGQYVKQSMYGVSGVFNNSLGYNKSESLYLWERGSGLLISIWESGEFKEEKICGMSVREVFALSGSQVKVTVCSEEYGQLKVSVLTQYEGCRMESRPVGSDYSSIVVRLLILLLVLWLKHGLPHHFHGCHFKKNILKSHGDFVENSLAGPLFFSLNHYSICLFFQYQEMELIIINSLIKTVNGLCHGASEAEFKNVYNPVELLLCYTLVTEWRFAHISSLFRVVYAYSGPTILLKRKPSVLSIFILVLALEPKHPELLATFSDFMFHYQKHPCYFFSTDFSMILSIYNISVEPKNVYDEIIGLFGWSKVHFATVPAESLPEPDFCKMTSSMHAQIKFETHYLMVIMEFYDIGFFLESPLVQMNPLPGEEVTPTLATLFCATPYASFITLTLIYSSISHCFIIRIFYIFLSLVTCFR